MVMLSLICQRMNFVSQLTQNPENIVYSMNPTMSTIFQTLLTIKIGTSDEKQAVSRAKYKEANKEKVARASRISNYRAQAKKIPGIMEQGTEAVYKWAEEKEEKRKSKFYPLIFILLF